MAPLGSRLPLAVLRLGQCLQAASGQLVSTSYHASLGQGSQLRSGLQRLFTAGARHGAAAPPLAQPGLAYIHAASVGEALRPWHLVRGFANDASKAAALRRLAAARARREVVRAPSTSGISKQQQEEQLAPVNAVMPAEYQASEAQANKYTVYDENGQVVALIAEDYTGIGNEIGRQLLRTRRSFTATVMSGDGSQVLFRVRRPAYLLTSTMFIEDAQGNTLGEVHRRWSLIKRNYDLYLGKRQFAAITGQFLAWEFELKDANGGTLALVDRNFQGFAKEIFTDAGKYVIHFGHQPQQAADIATETVRARSGQPSTPHVTPMAQTRTDIQVIPTVTGNQLMVARPLELSERMVTLACAIAIDYDFFSQHSNSSGIITPPIIFPGGGGGAVPVPAAGEAAANATAGGAASEAAPGAEAGGLGVGGTPPPSSSSSASSAGAEGADFDAGKSWQQGGDDSEMKWDLGGGGEGTGGSSEEGSGGIMGVARTLWGVLSGNDE